MSEIPALKFHLLCYFIQIIMEVVDVMAVHNKKGSNGGGNLVGDDIIHLIATSRQVLPSPGKIFFTGHFLWPPKLVFLSGLYVLAFSPSKGEDLFPLDFVDNTTL